MRNIGIGMLGLGNVGSGVYKLLQNHAQDISRHEHVHLEIKSILVRDPAKKRNVDIDPALITDSFDALMAKPDIQIIAEFIGGVEPARSYILAALGKGITVVTANKELMAKCWPELESVARANHAGLYYEASVAGGVPVIRAVASSLQANRIDKVLGIINGTTNYILSQMSNEQKDYDQVLTQAQELGLAESDPSSDVEGLDAAYKLSILASLAFHQRIPVDKIDRQGITRITRQDIQYGKEFGLVLKLLAVAKWNDGQLEARVQPTFIPQNHPLAAVQDSFNAVFIHGDAVGDLMFYGRGAGDFPTASAIVSDIIIAAKAGHHHYADFLQMNQGQTIMTFIDNWESEYFIHVQVEDKPGVLAKMANVFGQCNVSIASLVQKDTHQGDRIASLVFLTHPVGRKAMDRAMELLGAISEVTRVINHICVESQI